MWQTHEKRLYNMSSKPCFSIYYGLASSDSELIHSFFSKKFFSIGVFHILSNAEAQFWIVNFNFFAFCQKLMFI